MSSLSDIAQSHTIREAGVRAAGTGLEARGIHAWFGKHHALADVSLDFAPGTVTALIGPSGCGKSTFIRTLNRMHEFIPSAARNAGKCASRHQTDQLGTVNLRMLGNDVVHLLRASYFVINQVHTHLSATANLQPQCAHRITAQ